MTTTTQLVDFLGVEKFKVFFNLSLVHITNQLKGEENKFLVV